jgi:hypothetical protein
MPNAVLYKGDLVSPIPCKAPVVIKLIVNPGCAKASIRKANLQAKKYGYSAAKYGVIFMSLLGVILFFGAPFFASLFTSFRLQVIPCPNSVPD